MIAYYAKRAVADMRSNIFLTAATVVSIALSMTVVAAFGLVFENTNRLLDSLQSENRVMVYLVDDADEAALESVRQNVQAMPETLSVEAIPRDQALELLKSEISDASAFLDSLQENPLPHSLAVTINPAVRQMDAFQDYVAAIESLERVDEVSFTERWLKRLVAVIRLVRISGFSLGCLCLLAAFFITANTVRLSLYSRRHEVEIMRLVGATDRFIIAPFYLQAMIQGGIGGLAGIAILFAGFWPINSVLVQETGLGPVFNLSFVPLSWCAGIVGLSSLLGWSGCYVSLKRYTGR